MRSGALAALASGLVLMLGGPALADPLDVLSVYAGTWRAEIEQFASDFGPASKETHSLRNDCWRTTLYYSCAQTVDGKQVALLVFTWDPASKTYASYPITPDGAAAGRGKLIVDGADWYFPWDQQKDGKTVHLRVANHFVGHDRIEYRQEWSMDGERWTVIGRGTEVRQ